MIQNKKSRQYSLDKVSIITQMRVLLQKKRVQYQHSNNQQKTPEHYPKMLISSMDFFNHQTSLILYFARIYFCSKAQFKLLNLSNISIVLNRFKASFNIQYFEKIKNQRNFHSMIKIKILKINFKRVFPCFLSGYLKKCNFCLKKENQLHQIFDEKIENQQKKEKQIKFPIQKSFDLNNQYGLPIKQLKFSIQVFLTTSNGKVKLASISKKLIEISQQEKEEELKFKNCPEKNANIQYSVSVSLSEKNIIYNKTEKNKLQKNINPLIDAQKSSTLQKKLLNDKQISSQTNLSQRRLKKYLETPQSSHDYQSTKNNAYQNHSQISVSNMKSSLYSKETLNSKNDCISKDSYQEVTQLLQKQKQKCVQLKNQIQNLQKDNQQLKKTLNQTKKELDISNHNVHQQKKFNKTLKSQLAKYKKETEKNLQNMKYQMQKLQFRQNLLKEKTKQLIFKLTTQKEENMVNSHQLVKQIQKCKRYELLKSKYEEQNQQKHIKQQDMINKLTLERQNLKNQIKNFKLKALRQEQAKNSQTKSQKENYQNFIVKFDELTKNYNLLKEQKIELQEKIQKKKVTLESLQNKLKQNNQYIKEMQKQLSQQYVQNKNLKQQLNKAQLNISHIQLCLKVVQNLEHELNQKQFQNDRLRNSLNFYEAQIKKNQNVIQELPIKKQQLQQKEKIILELKLLIFQKDEQIENLQKMKLQQTQLKQQMIQNSKKENYQKSFSIEKLRKSLKIEQHSFFSNEEKQKLIKQNKNLIKKIQRLQQDNKQLMKASKSKQENQFHRSKELEQYIQRLKQQVESKQKIFKLSQNLLTKRVKQLQVQKQALKICLQSKQSKGLTQKNQFEAKQKKTLKKLNQCKNQIQDKQLIITSFKINFQKCQSMISQFSKIIENLQKNARISSIVLLPLRENIKKTVQIYVKLSKLIQTSKSKQDLAKGQKQEFQQIRKRKLNRYKQYIQPQRDLKLNLNQFQIGSSKNLQQEKQMQNQKEKEKELQIPQQNSYIIKYEQN